MTTGATAAGRRFRPAHSRGGNRATGGSLTKGPERWLDNLTQQSSDGQNLAGEFRQWRIPAGWLIQIELAWLIVATLLGGYLSGLPEDNWWAWAYRTFTGGNVLGLFVLGNMAGYLIYEEVRMVLSRIYHREKVEDILAREANADAKLKAMVDAAVSKAMADAMEPMAAARASALEEYRQAVAAWYERQQAAQRAGLPFAEPPPGYDNGGKGGGAAG